MTATIGFTGGAGSTASININGSPVVTLGTAGIESGLTNNAVQSGLTTPTHFKNKLLNGAMMIDQRNAGVAANIVSAWPNYVLDRWSVIASTTVSGTLTAQRITDIGTTSTGYLLRIAKTTGTYAGNLIAYQILESIETYPLVGKTLTLSFYARTGSAYAGATTPLVTVHTGTGIDQGGVGGISAWTGYGTATLTTNKNPNLTTTFQKYSFTFTLGSSVREMAVAIGRTCTSATGTANDYIDISDVQLEEGSIDTTMEISPSQLVLERCFRYYQECYMGLQAAAVGGCLVYIPFPVEMRTTPSKAVVSAGTSVTATITNDGVPMGNKGYSFQLNVTGAGGYWINRLQAYGAEL